MLSKKRDRAQVRFEPYKDGECTFAFHPDRLLGRSPSSQLAVGISSSPDSQLAFLVAGGAVGECVGSQDSQTHLELSGTAVGEREQLQNVTFFN